MATKVTISNDFIVEAMQSETVREALKARAARIAARARALASAEAPDMRIEQIDGTRPKGRPYSRVTGSDIDQEWGTSRTERRRILGRAREA